MGHREVGLILAVCFALVLPASRAASPPRGQLRGMVVDENGVPVVSALVLVTTPSSRTLTAYTDSAGRFTLEDLEPGQYKVSLNKPGYFRVALQPVEIREGLNEISFSFQHETEIQERVEVTSTPNPVDPAATSHQETLVAREIRDLPAPSTHDLKSVLPALPGIVRDNTGQLHVAGGRAGETQILLDGFDIGDPISGTLTARVNVDTLRDVQLDSGRYAAQYGGGGAGVLALDTTVGDDRWRVGATNFIPGLDIERGVHLGNFYPRFTLSGPLVRERAWFSEALSIQRSYKLVTELPPGADTTTQWAGDNLLRAQVNLTPHNLLQGSFLYNRQDSSHLNLGPFSPVSTTTDLRSQRSFLAVKDQIWTRRVLFDFGVAADLGHQDSAPMGPLPYVVRPDGTSGNYFEALRQRARRWQGIAGVTLPSLHWRGTHNVQAGALIERTSWNQAAARSEIAVEREDGSPLQRTQFSGPAVFGIKDTQAGFYALDSWTVARPLVLQIGVRGDWDLFLGHALASPRISANIIPWSDQRSKLSIAWGTYYQPVRFDTLGESYDQQRLDTFYDPTGQRAILGLVTTRFALSQSGLKPPYFGTANAEWVQKIGQGTFAGVNLLFRSGRDGLAYELQSSEQSSRLFLLQNNRRDSYRALQFSLRRSFGDKAEVSATYTRSRARSNEVFDFTLGSLAFVPQQPGPLEWDAPNRLISTGWAPVPFWGLFLSYFLEYRTGFPFSVVDQQQQLVGEPNRLRFPGYVNLNLGIEKRFKFFRRVWAVRLAIINASGRANPDSVINNVDAPHYLTFAGGQKRSFTARIRLVG